MTGSHSAALEPSRRRRRARRQSRVLALLRRHRLFRSLRLPGLSWTGFFSPGFFSPGFFSPGFSWPRVFGIGVLFAAAPALAASPESVFHIDRNKNRNQVHYGVHVDDRCQPVGDEPVYNYWLRREKDPPVVEPLRMLQQAAYGFQKQRIENDGRIEIRLRALPDRQLVVRILPVGRTCKAETFITIAGKQAYLDKVFVFADEGILLPSVRYIEIYGRSNDGHAVYEKITLDD